MKIEKDIKVQVESRFFFVNRQEKKDRQKPLIHVKIYKFQKKALKKGLFVFFKGQNVHCALVLSPQPRLASRFFAAAANSGGGAGGGCKALWRQPLHSVLKWVFSGHLYLYIFF